MDEPQFVDDLKLKLASHEAPLPSLPRSLQKKRVSSFVKLGMKRSLALHGILLASFAVSGLIDYFFFSKASDQARLKAELSRDAIRVDMVDLPRAKLEELSKIDLTQELDKSEPEEAPVKPPTPSPTAMVDRTKPPEKPVPVKKEEKIPEKLKEIRERLRADLRRKELVAKLKSAAPDGAGRQIIAGNMISEGYSVTGDIAKDSDVYKGKVRALVQKYWSAPGWMNASKLQARIVVKIAGDGRIINKQFLKKSGNAEFDGDVEKAIELAEPFPVPPESLKKTLMEDGIEWGFPK